MANSVPYYFQGKGIHIYLIKPDIEYKCWNVALALTQKSYEDFLKLKEPKGETAGILNELKSTDDGYVAQFRRPIEKAFKGQIQRLSAPKVLDKDGAPWDESQGIGKGSDITVKVEWYTFTSPFSKKRGSAIRLVSARIDHLVPWEIKKDFSEVELKAIEGLPEQPAPELF